MEISEAQALQAEYDFTYWEHGPGTETTEHQLSHVGKLVGKLATYVEACQHGEHPAADQLIDEVIPDLFIYALREANNQGNSLEEMFLKRYDQLVEHFSQRNDGTEV
jgi:hypothetical protein